ncbi:sortase B [Paenibacillus phyllosphaerae]|uniref:Sortase B n=1 Tax=Paenibacillus phyllosphaerae TaxID=274593 RepID=A0A7W5B2J6_9BACL|nr:class B sortase [Paenibacillus phyllosphaerae]MBB3112461.1 sortase B [Paenibacillus phyllosphaerae]
MRVMRLGTIGKWLSLLVFLYAALRMIGIGWEYYDNSQSVNELQNLFHERPLQAVAWNIPLSLPVTQTGAGEEEQPAAVPEEDLCDDRCEEQRGRFAPLLELNPDIVGWIQLEGSTIDYPIVQAADNERYLTLNYKGEPSSAGSIFMDYRNDPGLTGRNTVLYGHRMKDGSMFGVLKHYVDLDYYKAHRTLRLDTPTDAYEVEVFAVYTTTTGVNYIETEFRDESAFGDFVQEIQQRSIYESDVQVTADDRIITLSTCDYSLDPSEGRFVVHGRLHRLG